jgi:hypothetical protein
MPRLLLLTLVVLAGNASAAAVEFFVSPTGQELAYRTSGGPPAHKENHK